MRTEMKREARTLALLDVENLVYGDPARATGADYSYAVLLAAARADLGSDDHVVVGFGSSNITGAFSSRDAWPTAALCCRNGSDGADRALCERLADLHAIARSYTTVVIGSGDHYFQPAVTALNELGVHTLVASWNNKLSARLRLAAKEVRLLDEPLAVADEVSIHCAA